jgi:hypothetical protein
VEVLCITPTGSPLLDVIPSHGMDAGAELLEEIEEFNHWNSIINPYGLKMDSENMVTMRISRTNVSIKGNNTVVKDMDKSIYVRN